MTIENIEDITLAELENMINKYHDNIDFKAYISAVNEESKKIYQFKHLKNQRNNYIHCTNGLLFKKFLQKKNYHQRLNP